MTTTEIPANRDEALERLIDNMERLVAEHDRLVARYTEIREKAEEILDDLDGEALGWVVDKVREIVNVGECHDQEDEERFAALEPPADGE